MSLPLHSTVHLSSLLLWPPSLHLLPASSLLQTLNSPSRPFLSCSLEALK